jgi:hypothetical protein
MNSLFCIMQMKKEGEHLVSDLHLLDGVLLSATASTLFH